MITKSAKRKVCQLMSRHTINRGTDIEILVSGCFYPKKKDMLEHVLYEYSTDENNNPFYLTNEEKDSICQKMLSNHLLADND